MPALPPPRSPVRSDWITIPADPGGDPAAVDLPGWWALPEQGEPRGGILVLPEVFGVNPWVRSVVDRLAGEGYAALAISTFARSAPALELGYTGEALIQGREHRDWVKIGRAHV